MSPPYGHDSPVVIRGLRASALRGGAIFRLNFLNTRPGVPTPSVKKADSRKAATGSRVSAVRHSNPNAVKSSNYSFARFKIGHTPRKNQRYRVATSRFIAYLVQSRKMDYTIYPPQKQENRRKICCRNYDEISAHVLCSLYKYAISSGFSTRSAQ